MTSSFFSNNLNWIFIIFIIFLFLYFLFQRNENFDNDNYNIKIYNFNASWCGHCMHFKPVWFKFVDSLDESDNIKAISVPCEENKNSDMVKKYQVEGFPTVIIEKNGKFEKYSGPRTVNGLRKALDLDPIDEDDYKTKTNYRDINLGKDNKTTIYNFNTKWCGYSVRFQPIWDKFMKENTNNNLNIIDVKCEDENNKDLCNKYIIPGYPTVLKDGPKGVEVYEGPRTIEGLQDFANN